MSKKWQNTVFSMSDKTKSMSSTKKKYAMRWLTIMLAITTGAMFAYYHAMTRSSSKKLWWTPLLSSIISPSWAAVKGTPKTYDLPFNQTQGGWQWQAFFVNHNLVLSHSNSSCEHKATGIFCPWYNEPDTMAQWSGTFASLSWQKNMSLMRFNLLQKGEQNTIIIENFDPKLEWLSDTTYTSSGNQLVIDKEQFPLVLYAKDYVYIGQQWFRHNTIIVVTKESVGPPFEHASITKEMPDYTFSEKLNLQLQQHRGADPMYTIPAYVSSPIPSDALISFATYQGQKNGTITQATIKDAAWKEVAVEGERNDGRYEIILSNTKKGQQHELLLQYKQGESLSNYVVTFTTANDFAVEPVKPLISSPNGMLTTGNQMRVCFTQPVVIDDFTKKLEQALGKDNYAVKWDYSYYRMHNPQKEQRCVSVSLFVDPTIATTISLKNIKSLYGQTTDRHYVHPPHEITKRDSYTKIVGTPVIVNPIANKQKVQVILKNKKEATLYYRACRFDDWLLNRQNNAKKENYYHNRNYLLHEFMSCDQTKTRSIQVENFDRRKENIVEFDYEQLFDAKEIVVAEFSLVPFEKQRGHMILNTNIGLIAKYGKNTAHIRSHSLDKGKPLQNLSYTMLYDSGSKLITKKGTFDEYLSFVFPENISFALLTVSDGNDTTYMTLPREQMFLEQMNGSYNNSFALNLREIGGNSYGFQSLAHRVFGFTDRALYKKGDDIFVSGWVRKPWKSPKPSWTVTIDVVDPQGNKIHTETLSSLDDFGGFTTKFSLSDEAILGTYSLSYSFYDDVLRQNSYFYGYVQVQEFKKPNIAIKTEVMQKNKKPHVRIAPSYYFGSLLDSFDIALQYSLQANNYALYDWTYCGTNRCDNPYYFNHYDRGNYQHSGGYLQINDYTASHMDLSLDIPTTSVAQLIMNATITDSATQEVVHTTLKEQILPEYLLGFEWRMHERHNLKEGDFTLKGQIKQKHWSDDDILKNYGNTSQKQTLTTKLFYKPFHTDQELGPDGEFYYSYEGRFSKISDKQLVTAADGNFSQKLTFEQPGLYIVQMMHQDGYQNSMRLYVYDTDTKSTHYGELSNNYVLKVSAKQREYEAGESIAINIDPYIVGATAIVTIEKWGEILYQEQKILDGEPLSIDAKKERYPNAHVSVAQIVGAEINDHVSSLRHEPRFFIGYHNIALSPSAMGVSFDVSLTNEKGKKQEYYQPWQKVKLRIATKDFDGNPLHARLTVAIVDKALLDIFDEIKKPLESIYVHSSPWFFVMANYKLLFKALNVFTSEWQKGGGWGRNPGQAIIGALSPRKIFRDIAFWRGGIITDKKWVVHLETTLPDNLTTRVVETIAVGQEGQMASDRHFFTVNQDVIVNAFLPRFITPYGSIRVPVSVLINKKEQQETKIAAVMKLGQKEYPLTINKEGRERYIDLSLETIDLEYILQHDSLSIVFVAQGQDAVEYQLPIRKENMLIRMFHAEITDKMTQTLPLQTPAKTAQIKASISDLPVVQLSKGISYLLRYPYGCSEQLLSSLYPTLIAKDLSSKWLLQPGIISGNKVNYQGMYTDIEEVVDTTLKKIYKNQHPNGLFGYWGSDEWGDMHLSIYVYHVLNYIEQLWYDIDDTVHKKLERAIKNFDDQTVHLYYLLQKALVGQELSLSQVDELLAQEDVLENQIMAFAIYAYKGKKRTDLIQNIEKNIQKARPNYQPYYDELVLKAYYMRALIQLGELEKALMYVHELATNVDSQSRWWRSTQSNVQVIRALGDFMIEYTTNQNDLSYTLHINGQKFVGDLWTGGLKEHSFTINNIQEIKTAFTSSTPLFVSIDVGYVPADLTAIIDQKYNVQSFGYTTDAMDMYTNTAIGAVSEHEGEFSIKKDAQQLAVVFAIPPNSFVMNQLDKEVQKNITFANNATSMNTRYTCTPTYYEVQFDRLFLYYESLPAGAACTVWFRTIKTHDATLPLMQSSLFEMYDTNVRATSTLY